MNILVINAGSSSLKYQLFNTRERRVLAKGLCERIGIDGGRVKHTKLSAGPGEGGGETVRDVEMGDHSAAIRVVTGLLTDSENGVVSSMAEISAVGHRVVHGGEYFNKSVLIDDEVIKAVEACVPLAPLHNPPSLLGVHACRAVMGGIPQAAVFDTAFHQTISPTGYLYPIPYQYYETHKIRRYGFHGTSVRYVSARAAEMLGDKRLKLVVCHLGNGSSITAVDGGASVDTSMGFTPLEGLPMGTRSGSIDPAICGFLAEKECLSASQVMDVLNKRSGMLGISGVSPDFRDLHQAAEQGNARAQTALDIFARSCKKMVGAYAAVMGGCDAIVFTAGIGENNSQMREWICGGLEYMGFELDREKNSVRGVEAVVSSASSRGKILVIPTNEELVIAMDTEALVSAAGN